MAVDTLVDQKVRSGLTILGIVIGIMSIVGITSLIRGLDESLRESISAMGVLPPRFANTLSVGK